MLTGLETHKNKFLATNKLVHSMMNISELFQLSFSDNNELTDFLERRENSHDCAVMLTTSLALRMVLGNEMPYFLIALNEMKASKGFSMQHYLQQHPHVEKYLHCAIEKLETVYHHLLQNRATKYEMDAEEESEDDSAEELYFDDEFEHKFIAASKNRFF
ncbi:hypothetical protein [Candidatus Berkiella aquae]|uniref:Uncharacterized protein n=1 Tax=Candidatus Berkiella aquae TaxID=295108 RepID=A0A0Q9YXL6_9GAMM|nr:hypothetical protein [Candidatus Berkiella aquae]MCS5711365.1 hypothetical protein [Candidatus Berkiella aquae]